MTVNEAIERIREHARIHLKKEPRAIHITEALQMACNTLEKQIPKKPGIPFDSIYREYECPVCPHKVDKTQQYCDKCGQALDWSDTNDR